MAVTPDPTGDNWRYQNWNSHDDAAPMVTAMPPAFLLGEGPNMPSRLRVDVGATGFDAGREFRFFYEFNVPATQSVWVKVTLPVVTHLREQILTVDSGAVRFRAWRLATDVGPWAAPASPDSGFFNRNSPAATEYSYTLVSTVEIGGDGAATTVSAECSEVGRVVTAGATAQKISVGGTLGSERAIPAGTYHLQLENIAASGASTGVYNIVMEERPTV